MRHQLILTSNYKICWHGMKPTTGKFISGFWILLPMFAKTVIKQSLTTPTALITAHITHAGELELSKETLKSAWEQLAC